MATVKGWGTSILQDQAIQLQGTGKGCPRALLPSISCWLGFLEYSDALQRHSGLGTDGLSHCKHKDWRDRDMQSAQIHFLQRPRV